MTETAIRDDIRAVGRALCERRLVVATDGNISVRLAGTQVLITVSGACLGALDDPDIAAGDLDDARFIASGISSEYRIHLAAYRERPDAQAVIHAHPPAVVALTLAGKNLDRLHLPELLLTLGEIPTAPFAVPGTEEAAVVVQRLLAGHDAVILDRHGAVALGESLREAYYNLERLQFAAQAALDALAAGGPVQLTPEQVRELRDAAERYSRGKMR